MPVRLARALSSSIQVEIYEFDLRTESIVKVDPAFLVNRDNWLVACRNRELLLDRAASEIDPIVAMSPQAITLHPNVETGDVMLRFRGLGFACWQDGAVSFGDNLRKKSTASTQHELKQLLHDLETHRHPLATDTRHRLYRAQPERWLETIVRKVVVTELRDDTFFAVIWLERDGQSISIDARPSDALALALRMDCPIFVEDEVLKSSKVASNVNDRVSSDELRKWLENLGEDDLGRYKM